MSAAQEESRWSDMALKKAQIIQPLCGLRPIPGDKMAEACRAAEQVVGKSVSHQTIRNWIKVYERDGLSGLERKSYTSRGSQLAPQLEEVIIGILLNEKGFSIAETQRRAKKYGRDHLKLPEEQLPTYHQVLFLSQQITADEKTFAHKGTRSYTRSRELYGLFEADYANHIWQSDHHQLDIIVIDPETGEHLGCPWITAFLDDYSRAICGYYLSLDHPSSMSIALALRDSLLETDKKWNVVYGIPSIIYIDNGRDYRSRHIEEVCLHFGIEQRFHEGYRPQSKGKVERFFGTLETMCISTLDGYVGSSVQKRPYKVKPKLSMGKLQERIDIFLSEYHERRHGTTRCPPRVRWQENMTTPRPIEGTGGSDGLGARIREVAQILFRCHLLIQESIDIREQCIANGERPKKIRPFNDALIAEAVKKSKRRGKQGRKRS